jgi:Na+/melibiose symporter-like transporter
MSDDHRKLDYACGRPGSRRRWLLIATITFAVCAAIILVPQDHRETAKERVVLAGVWLVGLSAAFTVLYLAITRRGR